MSLQRSKPSGRSAEKGIYALLFSNPSCALRIGALGEIGFRKGWHIYIGSARGPGGFSRVTRHLRLARQRDRGPRWHVDYLLLSPGFTLRHIVCGPGDRDLECALARALGGPAIPSFGSGDCTCESHLLFRSTDPLDEVREAVTSLGLIPASTTLISRDLPSVGIEKD